MYAHPYNLLDGHVVFDAALLRHYLYPDERTPENALDYAVYDHAFADWTYAPVGLTWDVQPGDVIFLKAAAVEKTPNFDDLRQR